MIHFIFVLYRKQVLLCYICFSLCTCSYLLIPNEEQHNICSYFSVAIVPLQKIQNVDIVLQGSEWPMFCRNIDSFPFRQISGARYVQFLAKVMPKNFVDFGMTCARKVGHIECPGFAGTRIKRCSGMKLVFIIIFPLFQNADD